MPDGRPAPAWSLSRRVACPRASSSPAGCGPRSLVACTSRWPSSTRSSRRSSSAARTVSLTGLTSTGLGRGDATPGTRSPPGSAEVPGLGGWVTCVRRRRPPLHRPLRRGRGAPARRGPLGVRDRGSGVVPRRARRRRPRGAIADVAESLLLVDLTDGAGHGGTLVAASWAKWAGLALAVVAAVVVGARQSRDHPRGAASPTAVRRRRCRAARPAGAARPGGSAACTPTGSRCSSSCPSPPSGWPRAPTSSTSSPTSSGSGSTTARRAWWLVRLSSTSSSASSSSSSGGCAATTSPRRVLPRRRALPRSPRCCRGSSPPRSSPVGGAAAVLLGPGRDRPPVRFAVALRRPGRRCVLGSRRPPRRRRDEPPWSAVPRGPVTAAAGATTTLVGDVLGVLVVVIPALGLVRAFVAPVALGDAAGLGVALLVLGRPRRPRRPLAPRRLVAAGPHAAAARAERPRHRPHPWPRSLDRVSRARRRSAARVGLRSSADGACSCWHRASSAAWLDRGRRRRRGHRARCGHGRGAAPRGHGHPASGGGRPDLLSRPVDARAADRAGDDDHRPHGGRSSGSSAATPGSTGCAPRDEVATPPSRVPRSSSGCRARLAAGARRAGAAARTSAIRPPGLRPRGGGRRHPGGGVDRPRRPTPCTRRGGPCADALMSSGASGGAVGLTVTAFAGRTGARVRRRRAAWPAPMPSASRSPGSAGARPRAVRHRHRRSRRRGRTAGSTAPG